MLLAPSIREIDGILTHAAPKPTLAVAHEAKRIWSQATGRPLRIVGGSKPYAQAAAFYSGDRTSAFADFNRKHSPWITDEAIARDGLLAICRTDDHRCLAWAAQMAGVRQETEFTVPADASSFITFRLIIFPPPDPR